jgi:hypothetical protein
LVKITWTISIFPWKSDHHHMCFSENQHLLSSFVGEAPWNPMKSPIKSLQCGPPQWCERCFINQQWKLSWIL